MASQPHGMRRSRWRPLRSALAFLCVALVTVSSILWARNVRGKQDRQSFRVNGARYLLLSESGRLTFIGPPVATAQEREEARGIAQMMSNADVKWEIRFDVDRRDYGKPFLAKDLSPSENQPERTTRGKEVSRKLWDRACTPATRKLACLMALEDDDRLVAAHLLIPVLPPQSLIRSPGRWDGWCLTTEWNGLQFKLFPRLPTGDEILGAKSGKPNQQNNAPWTGSVSCTGPQQIQIDPAQATRIRDHWYQIYGAPLGSVPHFIPMGIGALPLLMWSLLSLRRRLLRRPGLCDECGYDLRGGHENCPECGTPVAVKPSMETKTLVHS